MAEVGRLRLRDGQLVVEGMAGRIIARIEPDDHMRVTKLADLYAPWAFLVGQTDGEIIVTWRQAPDEDRGFIDAEATEVRTRPPADGEIGSGDA